MWKRPSALPAISETLEEVVREGARRMLERALCAEVDAYLGRRRYDRVDRAAGRLVLVRIAVMLYVLTVGLRPN